MNPIEWLKGKKTYFVAVAAVATALGGFVAGEVSLTQLVEAIFAAVAVMTLRAGVTKSG